MNNEILIRKVKNGYRVTNQDIETSKGFIIKLCKTLPEAIKVANKHRVGYGVVIKDELEERDFYPLTKKKGFAKVKILKS